MWAPVPAVVIENAPSVSADPTNVSAAVVIAAVLTVMDLVAATLASLVVIDWATLFATLNVSTPVTLARLAAVRAVPDAVIVKVSPVPVPPVKVSLLSKLASVDVTVTAAADAEAFTVSLPSSEQQLMH